MPCYCGTIRQYLVGGFPGKNRRFVALCPVEHQPGPYGQQTHQVQLRGGGGGEDVGEGRGRVWERERGGRVGVLEISYACPDY